MSVRTDDKGEWLTIDWHRDDGKSMSKEVMRNNDSEIRPATHGEWFGLYRIRRCTIGDKTGKHGKYVGEEVVVTSEFIYAGQRVCNMGSPKFRKLREDVFEFEMGTKPVKFFVVLLHHKYTIKKLTKVS